ncbi:MAG TPA: hypothetical protein VF783_10085 [Terriglobales bacterium]
MPPQIALFMASRPRFSLAILTREMAPPEVLAGIVDVNSPTVNDEILAPMGGVRDSGWGPTGPRSLDDFSDVTWINSHGGQRQYPF